MAATPKNGVFTFRGIRTGRRYGVNAYFSDVANALVTFNPQGAAASGSLNYYQAPEDVVLEDVSITTGLVDTTGFQMTSGGNLIPSTAASYANNINTLPTRFPPTISYAKGSNIGASQF